MFEAVKAYLDSLTFEQKRDLVYNLKAFQGLMTLLLAKGVILKDPVTGHIHILADHDRLDEFMAVHSKLTLQGIQILDKRNGKNEQPKVIKRQKNKKTR